MNHLTIYERVDYAISECSIPRIIAAPLIGAGAIMVYRDIKIAYEASQAAGENLATVAAAAAFIKVFLVTGCIYCWNSRKILGGFATVASMAACCLAALLLHSYSMVSALDFAFAGRDKLVTGQEQAIGDRKRLEDRYAAASARVQAASGARSVSVIAAEVTRIESALASAKARETSEAAAESAERIDVRCGERCKLAFANKNAAIAEQRALAPQLQALSVELVGARSAEKALIEMAEIDAALGNLKTVGHKDPQAYSQAVVLSGLGFKVDPKNAQHVENVGLLKPVLLALVNEFGATLAFLLGFAFWNSTAAQTVQIEAPVRRDGGITELRRIPDPLPLPKPSGEQLALEELTNLIHASRGRVLDQRRKIAGHLNVPVSTFCGRVNAWIADKKIIVIEDGGTRYLTLPYRSRVAAQVRQREMATA